MADWGNKCIQFIQSVIESGVIFTVSEIHRFLYFFHFSQVVPYLIALLAKQDVQVQKAALRAVGNLATGTDEQTQVPIDCGALMMMPALLAHQNKKINQVLTTYHEMHVI
jgi:hypothetical protein